MTECRNCGAPLDKPEQEVCHDCWLAEVDGVIVPDCAHRSTVTREESTDETEDVVSILCLDCNKVLELVSRREP